LRFHIVGIGGAGMSAIARVLMGRGHDVTGSDNGPWPLAEALARDGAAVHERFAAEHVPGSDVVIRSSAYREDNVEVRAALDRGIVVWKRDDAWKFLAEGQRVVAIAGTHGKSTTTALVWSALRAGNIDASLICGAVLRSLGTNAHAGRAKTLVIEADEYDNAFLALHPDVAVVTTVDHDHVDVFPTRESYRDAFRAFARGTAAGGTLICCADDEGARALAEWTRENTTVCLLTYGHLDGATYPVWQTEDSKDRYVVAAASRRRSDRTEYGLQIRGWHNVLNAAAALLAAERIGVSRERARSGVEEFTGIERRLELLGSVGGIDVIDDYAHHPAEIRAGLATFGERWGRTIVVFQPHTPSRLTAFFDEFAAVLRAADAVVIVETFRSAREPADSSGRARALANAVGGRYAPDGDAAARIAADLARSGDVVLVMGAGDVRPVGERILELLRAPV